MTLDVAFLSAFVLKTDLEKYYPGGLRGWHADHLHCKSDDDLVRLASMSGGELSEQVDQLVARGIPADRITVADWTGGPWKESPGIRLQATEIDSYPFKRWQALSEVEAGTKGEAAAPGPL